MIFTSDEQMIEFAKKAKLEDWQTLLFAKNRNSVQVHSKGQLFYKIDRLFPHEHPMSKNHRLISFEPITQGSFQKGIDQISRIFQNASYDVEASEKTIQFLNADQFDDKNFYAYFLDLWVHTALGEDPNAVFVLYPDEFTRDKDFDQLQAIKSDHIVYMDPETIIFKSEHRSEIKNKIEKTFLECGDPYWSERGQLYTTPLKQRYSATYADILCTEFVNTTYHIFTATESGEYKFYELHYVKDAQGIVIPNAYEISEYTLNNTQYTPAAFAGGKKIDKVYQSFLQPFVPFGNDCLINHSQHKAVNASFAFPEKAEVETPCDNQDCHNGQVSCEVSDKYPEGLKPCPKCDGTGYSTVQSPYKIHKRRLNIGGMSDEDKNALSIPPVEYFTPDVSILDYSANEWKEDLARAERAIYIAQDRTTGNVQSADAKEIDLEQFYSFLLLVAKTYFGLLRFFIQQFENYLNASPMRVTVEMPYSFAILTESEAFDYLNKLLTSQAPDIIKGQQIQNFISKFVSNSSPVAKAYDVLKRVDLLLLKTDSQIATLKANNINDQVTKQWAIHTYAYPVLMQMYEEDNLLFLQDTKVIADKLNKNLEPYITAPKPPLTQTAFNAAQ